jgi:hypothetical protein
MATKFNTGDTVILRPHDIDPIDGQAPWDQAMEAVVGQRAVYVRSHGNRGSRAICIVAVDTAFGKRHFYWREASLKLVGSTDFEEVPPTLRSIPKVEEKPEWMISRSACLEPNQCSKCGAPRSPTNPCEYHEPKPASAPVKGWSFYE